MILALVLSLFASESDSVGWTLSAIPSASLSFSPALPGHPWNLGVAEQYAGNWRALRVDPEVARQWDTMPALATLELGAAIDSFRLHTVLPLRRDLEAWAEDPTGSNVPRGAGEVDINIPYEGWLRWGGVHLGSLQAGRFRKSFSESPHGVILGGNDVHDALWWRLPMGRWTFEWFASSLNPWLPGIGSDGSVQPGSQAQLQQTETIPNSRGRVYDEPYKTLFLHKLSCRLGNWEVAVVEQEMVGGKAPTWREYIPIMVWHDNYGDGSSKISTSLDLSWNPGEAGAFHLQGILEGTPAPVGETQGYVPKAVWGSNLGWRRSWQTENGLWSGSFDATATSPTLNNYQIPLLKGISRRLYRSNDEDQSSPTFADTWMVDQPLAYHRGPDAVDFWSNWGWTHPSADFGAGLEADFLQQGDASLWMNDDSLQNRTLPLSGIVEREVRVSASAWRTWETWTFRAGVGGSRIWNANHVQGDDRWVGSIFGGVGWTL
jgi:hypothetical protein